MTFPPITPTREEINALFAQAAAEQRASDQAGQWAGTVYLLHFAVPLYHAQHYLGWTQHDLQWRLDAHRHNQGAKLLRAANERGIEWWLVRTWEGCDRSVERRLKDRHESPRLCPLCHPHAWERARCPLPEHAWEVIDPYRFVGWVRCGVCRQEGVCLTCRGAVAVPAGILVVPCAAHGGAGGEVPRG
jgi:predicted GIY-YIG superfamily endonuclease